jgi:hypothetical protein
MGEMSWNRVGGIYIYDSVGGSEKGGEWNVGPINLLLCDRRNVAGGGPGAGLASEPISSYLFASVYIFIPYSPLRSTKGRVTRRGNFFHRCITVR